MYMYMVPPPPRNPTPQVSCLHVLEAAAADCIQCCFMIICFCYVLFTTALAHDASGSGAQ